MINTGAIILAAGRSARLGGIKQLLPLDHKTLLQHVIDEVIKAGAAPVLVITGAYHQEVAASVGDREVELVFNKNWQEGIASGIVAGVRQMIAGHKNVTSILLAVCDQPFVSASLFRQLVETQTGTSKPIVACVYADTVGVPVLFTHTCFDQLLGLQGDEGAKKILMRNPQDLATVDFPLGHIDIDTQEDYERLITR